MKDTLQKVGGLSFILGVAAIALNYMNMVPQILAWIYMWGESTAWIIKIAFVVIGGILWTIGKTMKDTPEQE